MISVNPNRQFSPRRRHRSRRRSPNHHEECVYVVCSDHLRSTSSKRVTGRMGIITCHQLTQRAIIVKFSVKNGARIWQAPDLELALLRRRVVKCAFASNFVKFDRSFWRSLRDHTYFMIRHLVRRSWQRDCTPFSRDDRTKWE